MEIQLPRFKREDVREEIRRIASTETQFVEFLDHSLDRMAQRGITARQVLRVLQDGEQLEAATWCTEQERGWRCKLRRVTAGDNVTVVAKLIEREHSVCLVVTTWEG